MIEERYLHQISSSAEISTLSKTKHVSRPRRASRFKTLLAFLGPAFIVSVAYIDPPMFVLEHK